MRCLKKEKPAEGLTFVSNEDKPKPKHGEVLIRVTHAGICGTDLHIYNWDRWSQRRIKPPLVTGHEFVGRIEAFGDGVEGLTIGQRVSAEGHITCGVCEYCRTGNGHICENVKIIGVDRHGCFADYLVMPQQNIWPVDERIPNEHASIFDPLGNAMHTVMSEVVSGKNVLITGAGAIGLFSIPIAKFMGANTILVAEPNEYRRNLAKTLKADVVIDPTKENLADAAAEAVGRHGVDILMEMSGHHVGFLDGLRCLRGGGTAVLLGIPKDPIALDWAEDVIFKAIKIIGVNGRRMFDTWYQSQRFLVAHGETINPVLTHQFSLEEFQTGFDLLRAGEAGKIILTISEDGS